MKNIIVHKDIIVQVTATIFLVLGMAIALYYGVFI